MSLKRLFNPFERFFSLIEKEARVLINDKGAMIITFFIPIISIVILATIFFWKFLIFFRAFHFWITLSMTRLTKVKSSRIIS